MARAPRVDGPAPAGLDARTGDGEAVGAQPEGGEQGHVLGVPVVGVAGDVAGVAAADLSWRVAEGVPHRGTPAVGGRRSLDLAGGRRRSPGEPRREAAGALVARRP